MTGGKWIFGQILHYGNRLLDDLWWKPVQIAGDLVGGFPALSELAAKAIDGAIQVHAGDGLVCLVSASIPWLTSFSNRR